MDQNDDILYGIIKNETQAVKNHNRASWVPFANGLTGTLQSMATKATEPGNDDIREEDFPYDFADPSNQRNNVGNDLSYEDSNENLEDEEADSYPIEQDRNENLEDEKADSYPIDHLGDYVVDDNIWNKSIEEIRSSGITGTTNKLKKNLGPGLTNGKRINTDESTAIEIASFTPFGQEFPSFHDNTSFSSSASSAQESDSLVLADLAKLKDVDLEAITDCIERRYRHDIVYINCGSTLISVNPLKPLEQCSYQHFKEYTQNSVSEIPHLFATSARAFRNIITQPQDQVILVSGESGSGKTEATKLLVRHLMYISGTDYETLPDRIIQTNLLLESFGNAKTKLNNNSSRFIKLLTLSINDSDKIASARVQDLMLEKSRVVHHGQRERTFHAFYSLLVGASDHLLESLFLKRDGEYKTTGDLTLLTANEKKLFKTLFDMQQDTFQLLKFTENEFQDVYTILAAILHLGNIEFQETDRDSLIIKDETVVSTVATLLKLDVKLLAKALIERTGRVGKDQKTLYEITQSQRRSSQDLTEQFTKRSRGKLFDIDAPSASRSTDYPTEADRLGTGDIINLPKTKKQAEDERDAAAMALYERLFGWLVRKINDSLRSYRKSVDIRVLDICGFENLDVNNFEQLCINLVNEQLQNFMNKQLFEDEARMYLQEGVKLKDMDIKSISNHPLVNMFLKKESGILSLIDADSKLESSTNEGLVSKLVNKFGNGGILVPSVSSTNEFRIRHFAGEVAYTADLFIERNRDNLSEATKDCFVRSESLLIQDLFSVKKADNGAISQTNYDFKGSKNLSSSTTGNLPVNNLSDIINSTRKTTIQQKFGDHSPTFQNGDLAKRSTNIKFFKNCLNELVSVLKSAHPHFVRCIKPNDLQLPGEFSKEKVQLQLKYSGVKEIIGIQNFVFPVNQTKDGFKRMYKDLAQKGSKSDLFHEILQVAKVDPSQYHIGRTMVFMTESGKNALDSTLIMKQKLQKWEQNQSDAKALAEELKKESHGIAPIPIHETTAASNDNDPTYMSPNSMKSMMDTPEEEESTDDEPDLEAPEDIPDDTPKKRRSISSWDIPQEITEEEERTDVHEQPTLMAIKFFVYIFLFVVNLCAFVMQKVSLLILTTGLKVKKHTVEDPKKRPNHKDVQTVFFLFLVIAICIPYALSWIISVAKLCFGNFKAPSPTTWFWVFLMETLHSVGLSLLVFRILPNLDVYRSVMLLSATAILPSVLKLIMSSSDFVVKKKLGLQCDPQGTNLKVVGKLLDIVAMLAQISVIPLIICMPYFTDESADYRLLSQSWDVLEIVGTFVLVSCSHWENFTDGNLFLELDRRSWFKNTVLKIRFQLQNGRHFPHVVTYLWKIGITLLMGYLLNEDVSFDYQDAMTFLSRHKYPVGASAISSVIALIISGFVAFYMSFVACMFQMQVISLAIPALLAVPATFAVFYVNNRVDFLNFLESDTEKELLSSQLVFPGYSHNLLFGIAWWLSLVVLTRHMWTPRVDRVANMARLFVTQSYCGILTSESIVLNRIRNPNKVRDYPQVSADGEVKIIFYKLEGEAIDDEVDKGKDEDGKGGVIPGKGDAAKDEVFGDQVDPAIPMLYACATMWHETRIEMIQLLKSLHRMDLDQYLRHFANQSVKGFDPDYYHFEAHIFFDDAIKNKSEKDPTRVPNSYVKELVNCMEVACSSIHGKPMKVQPPIKVPTPYGGQLIWQMPGDNLLFVHLKDNKKIRNKKRWSQVMYMYYLIVYRQIMLNRLDALEKLKAWNAEGRKLSIGVINSLLGEKAATKVRNTFLLALDGDTDFSPGSIKILLDRMKDDKVGAACGRIHPIGSGPMIWYQKFEYAIGHWMQKSAEHVFGCVLCSPGCFSLFRASALLDTNVMKKYTTTPTAPAHHLQYDQGEDRWLCTLLLQQGYRIEYAAAADAWTFAPEGFNEFFNQRRRWTPSTIANILDLLGSASSTTKNNANISRLYIAYQWLLMLMTVLGPGTIIMMIAGAAKLVFGMSLVEAYVFATVPAAAFTLVCFWCKSRAQLIFAGILSVVYTFIMMIVLVGTIITATTEGILHPSVIVITMLIGIFLIAGLCHPQEIGCLVHGIMYLLTIPSGYLLLVIYSICNLNDVSWGTRMDPTEEEKLELEKKKKEKEERKKKKAEIGFFGRIFNSGGENIKSLTEEIKKLIPKKTPSPDEQILGIAATASDGMDPAGNKVVDLLAQIQNTLKLILNKDGSNNLSDDSLTSVIVDQPQTSQQPLGAEPASTPTSQATLKAQEVEASKLAEKAKRKMDAKDLKHPEWSKDDGLGKGGVIRANKYEIDFWKEFIKKYLMPIIPSEKEKEVLANDLRELRNSSAFAMIVVNLLWMAINFMFQLTNAARFTITYGSNGDSKIEESVLGMGFVFLLLLLLIIQMFGMFIHRMGTVQQLLAITEIRICKTQGGNTSDKKQDRADIIKMVRRFLKSPLAENTVAETVSPVMAPASLQRIGVTIARQSAKIPGHESNNESLMKDIGKTMRNAKFNLASSSSGKKRLPEDVDSEGPPVPPRNRPSQVQRILINTMGLTQKERRDLAEKIDIDDDDDVVSEMPKSAGVMTMMLKQTTKKFD